MNLISRSFSRILYSSLHPRTSSPLPLPLAAITRTRKWVLTSQQQLHFTTSPTTTTTNSRGRKPKADRRLKAEEAKEKERPRPREIVYQKEVANWVNLIGFVDQPVQVETFADGKLWAGTVMSQPSGSDSGSDSSPFWIPLIFEGDLAHTAAQHLKKNDQIHVSGRLFVDSPPNLGNRQVNFQVMVQNLSFVLSPPAETDVSTEKEEDGAQKRSSRVKKDTEDPLDSWRDLLDNPKEWWDYRENKRNELVKPRHPDFKRKDGLSLWLNKAPEWVLSKLEGLEFVIPTLRTKQTKQHKGDESWKDLVENPDKWWDNRSKKKNAKSPDFRHKETGEALWLNESPTWVLPKLPPLNAKQDATVGTKDSQPS